MAGHSLDSSYDSLLADCKNGVGSKQLRHSANEDSTSMPSTTSFGAFEAKIFTETPWQVVASWISLPALIAYAASVTDEHARFG